MSTTRHRWPALLGALATCVLLSGCFGSGSGDDSSASAPETSVPATDDSPSGSSSTPTTTPSDTPSSSPTAPAAALRFSPKSDGRHNRECLTLHPGDDPAEFLYYPVVFTPSVDVTIQSIGTDHTGGVVDAGAWVAETGPTPETGTLKGWPPPKILTSDPNLRWSQRVTAAGTTLQAGVAYNVFLHLQVDPTPGDAVVNGLSFHYQSADGGPNGTESDWVAHTTFSMSC